LSPHLTFAQLRIVVLSTLGALVVLGETWLFLSLPLLEYAVAMAIACHLFVIRCEEPTLGRTFGGSYAEYRRTVARWIPRRPRHT